MKKVGIIIFVIALIGGVIVANFFSFGRMPGSLFNFTCGFGSVKGSGNVTTDRRLVSGFKAVDVGGAFQVEITAQKDFGVEVVADDNLLPYVKTDVSGGVLRIESERRFSTNNPLLVRVSAPDINNLDISGAANVTVNDLKNDSFAVDGSGASKIALNGETSKLTLDVSGATKVDAENLKAVNATIESSGASHVSVNVSGELTADASGASRVVYTGTPSNVVSKHSGAGSVAQK
jgi:hypothetical protein